MFQQICTKYTYIRFIVKFKSFNTMRLLSLCNRCKVLYNIAIFSVIFTNCLKNIIIARRHSLNNIDFNTILYAMRQSKHICEFQF